MVFNKLFGSRNGTASSAAGQQEGIPLTGLEKTVPRSKADKDSMDSGPVESKDIKIAIAAYNIQRRILEALHDTLQASLRADHTMDLWKYKMSLKDQAASARIRRHLESNREPCTGFSCVNRPVSCEECVMSACTFVSQKLAIAKFMFLQAKERTTAAKECKEQLEVLKQEFGDCIVPGRNGGIREADCASEQHALLADLGFANTSTDQGERGWEDDLRDMIRLDVSKERQEKAKLRRTTSRKKFKNAGRASACFRPGRLPVVLESPHED